MLTETPPQKCNNTIFDVWVTYDQNNRGRPHYPCYKTSDAKIGSAFTLEDAEHIIQEAISDGCGVYGLNLVHSYRIKQMPVGHYAEEHASLTEYVYDDEGHRLDKREYAYEDGIFEGRTQEDIRFQVGDICECLICDKVVLMIVAETPPDKDIVAYRTRTGFFNADATDDCYVVINSNGKKAWESHVSPLDMFMPRYKYLPQTEKRLRTALADYRTRPVRLAIENITGEEQLKGILDELGITASIEQPPWEGHCYNLIMDSLKPFDDGPLILSIPRKYVMKQLNRVRVGLFRLAGRKLPGYGFRPKPYEVDYPKASPYHHYSF
ncbi:MAG: hypothetical protein MR793_05500 [Bacteroidales bacterium]|nr:hypothetical protein [Bacteroidales bacterium]